MKKIKCTWEHFEPKHFIKGKYYEVREQYQKFAFDEPVDISVWDENGSAHALSVGFRQLYFERPTVLKGKAWQDYMRTNGLLEVLKMHNAQMMLYSGVTWKHTPIYKIGGYYYSHKIPRGYTNISSLKKLL